MHPELIDDESSDFSANANQVGTAWLLAAVLVTLLMTVVAPLLTA
jgi:hypothetical protein